MKKILIILVIFFYSCNTEYKSDIEFIKKNFDYDFKEFYQKKLSIREHTKNEIKIIYTRVKPNGDDEYSNIIFDIINDSIYSREETFLISQWTKNLLIDFIKLKVDYLEVDKYQNVKINLDNFERYDIVKVNNATIFFTEMNKKNFKGVVGEWYIRKK